MQARMHPSWIQAGHGGGPLPEYDWPQSSQSSQPPHPPAGQSGDLPGEPPPSSHSSPPLVLSSSPQRPLFQPPPASVRGNSDSSLLNNNVSGHPATPSLRSDSVVCDRCGKIFDKRHELNKHRKRQCTENPPFACPVAGCDRKLQYQKDLTRHMREKHPGPDTAVFHCPHPGCKFAVDGKSFKRQDNLNRHLKSQHE
ncbi:hypothetical protein F5B17DRAFT_428491 [Nemania serpens]|nr:hypothetical protein F5B17DRAFT_428491 [Nemania serpens]